MALAVPEVHGPTEVVWVLPENSRVWRPVNFSLSGSCLKLYATTSLDRLFHSSEWDLRGDILGGKSSQSH
jgi:hypothetical protein